MTSKLLFFTFGNAGGGGKTLFGRITQCLAESTERTTRIIDADAGNRSISRIIPSSDALVFGAKAFIGAEIVQVHQNVDVLIIDCAANASTETYDIIPLLKAAAAAGQRQDRHTVGLIPVSPNKPGAIGAARAARAAFVEAKIDVHVVLNNADGSRNFVCDEHGLIDGIPFPQLPPGFVSVLNNSPRSFRDLLNDPPPQHERAMDYIAEWLEQCSAARCFAPYFNFDANALNLGRNRPKKLQFNVATERDAKDHNLKLNEEATECRTLFIGTEPHSSNFSVVARRYRQAMIDYQLS